ncbi:MAG: choice-of-anchor Q domain-containing protein [Myxococcota bacterium]
MTSEGVRIDRWMPVASRVLSVAFGCLAPGCIGVPPPPPGADTGSASASADESSGSTSTQGATGTSTLTETADESETSAPPTDCGNGVVDDDEICDDGNLEDGDWCSADCLQAHCLVPLSHVGVQAGIDDNTCSTLWVMPGVYNERVTIGRNVELQPIDAGVVIDADGLGRPLTVEAGTVTVGALELTGGLAIDGGGIHNAGNLILEGTLVTGNLASVDEGTARGGGVFSIGPSLALLGAQIHDNQALSAGGTSTAFGGGIFVSGGTVTMSEGARITQNLAEAMGSAANAGGGGIHADDATVASNGETRIEDNTVRCSDDGLVALSVWGGGLYLRDSSLDMAGGIIHGNRVENLGLLTGSAGLVADGGGLYLTSSSANFDRTEISDNLAMVDGSGTASSVRGGGLAAFGTSEVVGSEIVFVGNNASSNLVDNMQGLSPVAGASGGGVYGRAGGGTDSVTITLSDCRLQSNRSIATIVANADVPGRAATGLGGGALINTGAGEGHGGLRLHRCLVTANRAEGTTRGLGGGVYARAGSGSSTVWMSADNSTFSGNSTVSYEVGGMAQGGGVYVGDGAQQAETRGGLYFCTVTDNECSLGGTDDDGRGGGLYSSGDPSAFQVAHTIVSANRASVQPNVGCFGGSIDSGGYNLAEGLSVCADPDSTDLLSVDPLLLPLANNGGLSMTHALADGSPARDGGHPVICTGAELAELTDDQRGEPRRLGLACDIGAVEEG